MHIFSLLFKSKHNKQRVKGANESWEYYFDQGREERDRQKERKEKGVLCLVAAYGGYYAFFLC